MRLTTIAVRNGQRRAFVGFEKEKHEQEVAVHVAGYNGLDNGQMLPIKVQIELNKLITK